MPLWKQLLLNLYYYGSYSVRRRQHSRAVAEGRVPLIVLFYHRVADDRANDWTLSNRMFARQIRWLQSRFELVSLQEIQRRLAAGENRRPCLSITFDDGYADNCREAIPLLIERQIPCTYFVTVENVLQGRAFSHDVSPTNGAEGNILLPNSLEQLKAMADAGIEIGAHTYTHADLGTIDDQRQLYREVVSAREELQKALGRPVRYFAFPFGHHANLNCRAFDMAREAGYEAVCSAYGGYNIPDGNSPDGNSPDGNSPNENAFHLQRIPADETMIRLKNWTTVDPRKLNTPRFVYQPPDADAMRPELIGVACGKDERP